MTTAFGLALASLVVVLGALIQYFSTIPRGKVPVKPIALTDELAGKRTLLKFFRGGWCPYCGAELEAFDAMLPDLEEYGVRVVR